MVPCVTCVWAKYVALFCIVCALVCIIVNFNGLQRRTYPVCWTDVDSLSKVEALIKAGVIGAWKCDDELTRTLIRSVNLLQVTRSRDRPHNAQSEQPIKLHNA